MSRDLNRAKPANVLWALEHGWLVGYVARGVEAVEAWANGAWCVCSPADVFNHPLPGVCEGVAV